MTPRDVAINLIKVYVERGDTYHSIKAGQLGCWCSDYHASIEKDKIHITEIDGISCDHFLSLQKVFDEIHFGQQSLV